MRHESPEQVWQGDEGDELPVWTSFPQNGPTRLPLLTWIQDQLEQPTYMQMSGSLIPFRNYQELRHGKPTKTGPMRIEMATALGSNSVYAEELNEPVSIIYGRSDSDRASYGRSARKEDIHLMAWMVRYSTKHPRTLRRLILITQGHLVRQLRRFVLGEAPAQEEWRVR
jgi:hypothetical protein